MICWNKNAFNQFGVLQVQDSELENFAYKQLEDYKKNYFKKIQALDVEDFIENYLKINVRFYKLSPDNSLYGLTAITDGYIPIINEDNELSMRFLEKGTICVDLEACKNDEHIIRYTMIHESGHSQFDIHIDKSLYDGNSYINDRETNIKGKFDFKKRTQRDWMEYHANKYASYLLMPASFVKKLYKIKHSEIMPGQRLGVRQRKLIWKMIYAVAKELNVSATAMARRFLSLGIISEKLFKALEINKKEGQNKT